MAHPGRVFLLPVFAGVVSLGSALAQDFGAEDPLPAGATGKVLELSGAVLPLSGKVLPIDGKILPIKGLGAGLAGNVSLVDAALSELDAKVEDKQITIDLAADVLFDFDNAELRPEAGPALTSVGEVLAAYPQARVVIEGHTDAKGSDAYNQELSERRARSVVEWLTGNGIANEMTARGLGEKSPVAPNQKADGSDDPEGRQKNRRVQITVNTE